MEHREPTCKLKQRLTVFVVCYPRTELDDIVVSERVDINILRGHYLRFQNISYYIGNLFRVSVMH